MLPFLPALLLLILRGPSALERSLPNGALPGSEAIYQNVAHRGGFFAARKHQALHQAVAQLMLLMPCAVECSRTSGIGEPLAVPSGVHESFSRGPNAVFIECERSRDGPNAV